MHARTAMCCGVMLNWFAWIFGLLLLSASLPHWNNYSFTTLPIDSETRTHTRFMRGDLASNLEWLQP